MKALRIASILLFETTPDLSLACMVLYILGLIGIFRKSGLKWGWALVPCYRDYQLSRCAGREAEGRGYFLTSAGMVILDILTIVTNYASTENLTTMDVLITVLVFTLGIVRLVYGIRIYSGMIEVYGLRRRWMWLCLSSYTNWLPLLIWGWSNKFQPAWKVEDIRALLAKLAHQGSAAVMDEGLTVNLKDRTVVENFQKKVLLRDIHMAIPQGHMVLLLGGSGAGKTTFLNAVNGYEKANAEVMLNGSNMYTQYKQMQYEVGFVPQSEMMRGKNTVINTQIGRAHV